MEVLLIVERRHEVFAQSRTWRRAVKLSACDEPASRCDVFNLCFQLFLAHPVGQPS